MSVERAQRRLRAFLRVIHGADYLAAKANDFATFTWLALLITAAFVASTVIWDYAIDPVNYVHAVWLRMVECAAVLIWALAARRDVRSTLTRSIMLIAPLVIEATFIQILALLDQGPSYGMGGFLYFFVFVPFLTLSQPFCFAVLVLALISVFPMIAALFGLSAGLDWQIYNAYVWMVFVPIAGILLLFEYLYWQVFSYRCQVESQAVTDALTELPNRRHFLAEGARSLAWHQRNARPASLLFIDIDYFKAINDGYGHTMGDAAINHVVQTILPQARASDLMARYGGEEFLILLSETPASAARDIAERMRAAVASQPFACVVERTRPVRLTVSIGVATYHGVSGETPDIDRLINEADLALYTAKRLGRDRVIGDDIEGSGQADAALVAD